MAAGKIRVTNTFAWAKDGAQIIFSATSSDDQSGEQAIENVQIIGATSEAITFGDVTTPGWVGFKNLNVTGGADIHVGNTDPATITDKVTTLRPGDGIVIKTSRIDWYAISSSGNSNLLVAAVEA